jgi:hypothetical protein
MEASAPEVKAAVDYARLMFGGRTGNEKIFAFTPFLVGGEYGMGIAILGEAGYVSSIFAERFPNYDTASDFCAAANKSMGYSDDTAQAIIIDTMNRSEFSRDQKSDKVSIKLDAAQIDHAIEALEFLGNDDTDVLDVLQDAKEQLAERFETSPSFG